jgi:hypothetical protein
MRRYTWTTRLTAGAAAAAGLSLLIGCSTEAGKDQSAESAAPSSQATATAESPAPKVKPGEIATSPAGVTTAVGADAQSTEEEYFQACHAAKTWMQGHPGDRAAAVERYLAAVQTPGVVGAGTWNIAWSALPLARQAGVIVAANAAARDECG